MAAIGSKRFPEQVCAVLVLEAGPGFDLRAAEEPMAARIRSGPPGALLRTRYGTPVRPRRLTVV